MKKALIIFIYLCSIPVGMVFRYVKRNRYDPRINKNIKSYRCKPDNTEFFSERSKSVGPKEGENPDCPDTMYPMW